MKVLKYTPNRSLVHYVMVLLHILNTLNLSWFSIWSWLNNEISPTGNFTKTIYITLTNEPCN